MPGVQPAAQPKPSRSRHHVPAGVPNPSAGPAGSRAGRRSPAHNDEGRGHGRTATLPCCQRCLPGAAATRGRFLSGVPPGGGGRASAGPRVPRARGCRSRRRRRGRPRAVSGEELSAGSRRARAPLGGRGETSPGGGASVPPPLTSGWARRRPCRCSRSPAGSDHAPGGSPPSWMGGTRQPRRCGRRRGGTEGGGGRGAGWGYREEPGGTGGGAVLPAPPGRARSRCLSPALLRRRHTAKTSAPQHLTADAGDGLKSGLDGGVLLCLLGLGLFVYSPLWLFVCLFF